MIRSLFIGFLILSALTTKGAGFQIVSNLNITPDTLPNIIGAAASACAERSSGSSSAGDRYIRRNYSFGTHRKGCGVIRKSLLSLENELNDLAALTGSAPVCDDLRQCGSSEHYIQAQMCTGEFCRTSGLSPPY